MVVETDCAFGQPECAGDKGRRWLAQNVERHGGVKAGLCGRGAGCQRADAKGKAHGGAVALLGKSDGCAYRRVTCEGDLHCRGEDAQAGRIGRLFRRIEKDGLRKVELARDLLQPSFG